MSEILWEEPAIISGKGKWTRILEPLMEHPKRWARIADKPTVSAASVAATGLRTGHLNRPAGHWEFAARGTVVYARFLGPEDGAE